MENRAIAGLLRELRARRDILGDDPMRTRAFERAADTIEELDRSAAEVAKEGGLLALPGIGKAIGAMIAEAVETGRIGALEDARAKLPSGLLEVLRLPGMGAKRVRTVWESLGVESVGELEQACNENRLVDLGGFGAKTQTKVLEGIRFLRSNAGRHLGAEALRASASLLASLRASAAVERVELAGEVRRGAEIVSELVVVLDGDAARAFGDDLGATRDGRDEAVWWWSDGWCVRVVTAPPERFAYEWLRASADAAHVARLDREARAKQTSLDVLARGARDEDEIYDRLGLRAVPAELREGDELPTDELLDALLPRGVIVGSLHNHSKWSDGSATLAEMVQAAIARGYSVHGVTDHSRAASYANGLDGARLAQQAAEIERLRATAPAGFALLHGCEVDILADGSLDLPDDVLGKLDFVVASVHSALGMDAEAQTRRIVRAVSHPLVTVLGHPTGRLLLGRVGSRFDLDAVARAAAANGTALEINASPHRLDLAPAMARRAVELGCDVAISPDAHSVGELANTPLGETVARRAGIARARVLNASSAELLVARLAERRERAMQRLG